MAAKNHSPRPLALRIVCVLLIVILYPCASYSPQIGWWVSLTGTALILGLGWVAWPADWVERMGFRLSFRAAAGAIVLFMVTAACAYGLLFAASRAAAVSFVPVHECPEFLRRVVFAAGQTLNEEIVLGALLLFGLARLLGKRRGLFISSAVALLFAVLHYAFYALRDPADFHAGRLSILALTSLFAVGVLRNNLILGCRHIAFAWAIHLGWNVYFFQSEFRFEQVDRQLNEPELFNHLFAYPLTVGVIAFAALLSASLFRRRG